MVVEFNHLLPVMPELGMGLPNTYLNSDRSLGTASTYDASDNCRE